MDKTLFPDQDPSALNAALNLDLVKGEGEILKALLYAMENGTMIAIHAPVLGSGTYMTGIVDISIDENNTIITTHGYDVTGYFLEKPRLKLSEIKSVIPFTSIFINPFLRIDKEDNS